MPCQSGSYSFIPDTHLYRLLQLYAKSVKAIFKNEKQVINKSKTPLTAIFKVLYRDR